MRTDYPFLPFDTLAEQGRVPRAPLRSWASSLVADLNGSRTDDFGLIEGCMNNAGLIEVYRGHLAMAENVCTRQIQWAARLTARHGMDGAGEYALQPWINLGRLHRLHGHTDLALHHFSLIIRALGGQTVAVGPIELDMASWMADGRHAARVKTLQNIYILDSIKTYWVAKDFPGALTFIEGARTLLGDDYLLLDEMEILTFARMQRFDEATPVFERPSWNSGGFIKLLRVAYRIGFQAARGERERAANLLSELAPRVLNTTGFTRPNDSSIPRFMQYFGGLAFQLGLEDIAVRVWKNGLEGARHLDDVPCRIGFLDVLIQHAGEEERASYEVERNDVLDTSLYVAFCAARGRAVDPNLAEDPVFDELHRRLRIATEAEA